MTLHPVRLAAFVSGRGSNLMAIHQELRSCGSQPPAELALCLSNRISPAAFGYCSAEHIPTVTISPGDFTAEEDYAVSMLKILTDFDIGLIVLAGYLQRVPPRVVEAYRGRILNVHPSLLPKFGGAGMYGRHVHQAVIDARESVSGVTVHLVDEQYDSGSILAQESVPLLPDDTAETLGARLLEVEHRLYPRVIIDLARKLNEPELEFNVKHG